MEQLRYQLRYALPCWLVGLLTDWLPDNRVTIRLRGGLHRPFFKHCGRGFTLARRVTFLNLHGIEIGENVYIATGAWIDGMGGVSIGDEVKISPYVVLASSTHCFKDGSVARGGSRAAPITIGRGTWISSHVVVAAGATIGQGCIVAGNAAVSKDIPDHTLAGGVPARVLGPTPDRVPNVFGRFSSVSLHHAGRRHDPRAGSPANEMRSLKTDRGAHRDDGIIRACLVSSIAINIKAFFRGQFAYLQRHGFRFTVIAGEPSREGLELPDDTAYYPVPITRTIAPLADLKALWRMVRLLRAGRFDLVQYTTPKAALLGSLASYLARVPVRLYLMWGIYYVGQTGFKRTVLKRLDWLACRVSSHVTFDGFDIRRFAIQEGLCDEKKTSVVGQGGDNGINLALFDPSKWKEAGLSARQQWGIPPDALVIGGVMRLVGDKGIHELVAAFEQLAARRPDLYLLLVGWFEEKDQPRPETRTTIDQHARIIVTGFQENVLPYYAAMDVFALPTYREGFSAVNLEAAAMGLPVVTTDAIGARESIVDGETGLVVPVRSVQTLADALQKLIDDRDLRLRMGSAGRRRVERDFEQESFWNALRRHREELLIAAGVFERDDGRWRRRAESK